MCRYVVARIQTKCGSNLFNLVNLFTHILASVPFVMNTIRNFVCLYSELEIDEPVILISFL